MLPKMTSGPLFETLFLACTIAYIPTVTQADEFGDVMKTSVPVKLEPLRVFADNDFWNVTSTPNCTLTLHRSTCTSPPLNMYDRIMWKTRLCFKWSCNHDDYAMRVEKCWSGSRHNPVYLIDNKGCTSEVSMLRTPSYEHNLQTATAIGWLTVRLVGEPFVRFGCDLRLCNKCDPNCSLLTPPKKCFDYVPYHANKGIINNWNASVNINELCVEEEPETSSLIDELSTEAPCLDGAHSSGGSAKSLVFLSTLALLI